MQGYVLPGLNPASVRVFAPSFCHIFAVGLVTLIAFTSLSRSLAVSFFLVFIAQLDVYVSVTIGVHIGATDIVHHYSFLSCACGC